MQVNIVDQVCGSGKTSAAINYINSLEENKRVIYVTPYLSEIERIKAACPDKEFYEPDVQKGRGRKLNDLQRLFNQKRNIITTHSLFGQMDEPCLQAISNNNYILIMDEVAEVCSPHEISKSDLKLLMSTYVTRGKHDLLSWNNQDYKGKFEPEKRLCNIGALACVNNTMLTWLFPAGVFEKFQEVWILTYMFYAQLQRCYYDLYDIEYNYKWVDGNSLDTYHFVDQKPESYYNSEPYRDKIKIVDNPKLNAIGDSGRNVGAVLDYGLSKSWYAKHNDTTMEIFQKTIYNFFYNVVKTPAKQNLWTTFKSYKSKLGGKGYTKGFLACNARATNAYRDRTSIAYLINVFFNPILCVYFKQQGVKVDSEGYALSELLQFLFRSAIRDKNEITVYVPSKRMRYLLQQWVAGEYDNYIERDPNTITDPYVSEESLDDWSDFNDY